MSKQGEKMQRKVLAVLRRHRCPLSAYEVLGELRQNHPKLAPMTIYRALAALTERGRVHRLESLSAFIACQCDNPQNAYILSICDDCGAVEQMVAPDLLKMLSNIAAQSGFVPTRHVIELCGLCASCRMGNIAV